MRQELVEYDQALPSCVPFDISTRQSISKLYTTFFFFFQCYPGELFGLFLCFNKTDYSIL